MSIINVNLKEDKSVKARMVLCTPEFAKYLLSINKNKRPLSRATVEKYKQEIIRGEWIPMQSGIGINLNGEMFDGQHRAAAIAETEIPVWILLVENLPYRADGVTDGQKPRPQYIQLGEPREYVQCAKFLASKNNKSTLKRSSVGNSIVKEYLELYRSHIELVVKSLKKHTPMSCVGVTGAMVEAHEYYGEKALEFCNLIQSDLHTEQLDPAYRLRKSILGRLGYPGGGGGEYQSWTYIKTCYAFNAWIEGKRISSVLSSNGITKPN
jgi:hypothetical protein